MAENKLSRLIEVFRSVRRMMDPPFADLMVPDSPKDRLMVSIGRIIAINRGGPLVRIPMTQGMAIAWYRTVSEEAAIAAVGEIIDFIENDLRACTLSGGALTSYLAERYGTNTYEIVMDDDDNDNDY